MRCNERCPSRVAVFEVDVPPKTWPGSPASRASLFRMSALGQKQTLAVHALMSALGQADIRTNLVYRLIDHLVRASKHGGWNCETQRLRGLEIDHQLILGRCLYWQVGRLLNRRNRPRRRASRQRRRRSVHSRPLAIYAVPLARRSDRDGSQPTRSRSRSTRHLGRAQRPQLLARPNRKSVV